MKRWNMAVCLVAIALVLILIAIASAWPAAAKAEQACNPVIVREAPADVAADAEPEIQCFVKGD
jgi:septal ring-binding cell division protein DamX